MPVLCSQDALPRHQCQRYQFAWVSAGLYQRSLLKAFTSTVETARFAVVIVDAPNIRVEEFRDFLATGQVSPPQLLA